MKNILFICESYKYGVSPNGICVGRVAENLVKEGNTVSVITLYNGVNQPEKEVVNGVTVYRVDAGFIATFLYKNVSLKNKKEQFLYKTTLTLSRINGLLKAFKYPLLSQKQVKNMYNKAQSLHNEHNFDYVVCAYHKIPDILAGINLKKKYPNIKLILYTLDAISGGWVPNILHSAKIPMDSLKRWEKYFFNYIDKMFAMESHRSYYEKNREYDKYADLIEYLDIPLLGPTEKSIKEANDKINMIYTGSMHKATANPQYLLKLLPMLPKACLYIYGGVSEDIDAEIRKNPLFNERIFLCGKVPYEEISNIQKNADILLNFGNANSNMIPCKIFEYISTGNKILSFTYSESDSSLPYIEKYPNGLIISEDDENIKENAELINSFTEKIAKNLSSELLCNLYEKNTPQYFAKKLPEV